MWYTSRMNNETHISTFARLLATENITVSHDKKAETASFNVVDRILTLPRWEVVDSHLYDMLIGHEVAHALWTPNDMDEESGCLAACVEIDPEHPGQAMGFLNIVEDARIERMIKNKFPGLRRDFSAGYSYLHNNLDLFSLSCDQSGIADMGLADRLNIHFKLGILGILNVPFSDEEQVYVQRMETTDTWQDVIDLARDIYVKAKQDQEHQNQQLMDVASVSVGSGDEGEEEGEAGAGSKMGEGIDPQTSDILQKLEREKFNQYYSNTDYVVDLPTPILDNMIIEPTQIEKFWEEHMKNLMLGQRNDVDTVRAECRSWMRSEQSTVNNLVKQFEMRKAADEHQRTMINKNGRLDTVKMIDYKWSEDIFAKNTIVREGKNHGIVIFVDWSGSMSDVIEPVMKQALTLAMFAQKANIPFEVMAFSDRSFSTDSSMVWNQDKLPDEPHMDPRFQDENGEYSYDKLSEWKKGKATHMNLIRFLHSGMNRRDFQKAAEMFFISAIGNSWYRKGPDGLPRPTLLRPTELQLHGTPLDECILAAHEIVMKFQRRNNLQIVNCAILTDGCGHSPGFHDTSLCNPYTGNVYGDRPEHREGGGRISSTQLLLMSLKETTGCNLIGMYLHGGKNPHNAYGWMDDVLPAYGKTMSQETKDVKKLWRDENFCVANGFNTKGYDEAYVIAAHTEIEQDMNLDSNASHAKLRNSFVKNLKKKGMSRTLIRRFVEMIAR